VRAVKSKEKTPGYTLVPNHAQITSACDNLIAYLLKPRGLFLKALSECVNLLLLLGDGGLLLHIQSRLFLHLTVFFEVLIEQHCVHCLVAHGVIFL
jgi:hypothetical protein